MSLFLQIAVSLTWILIKRPPELQAYGAESVIREVNTDIWGESEERDFCDGV